MVCLVVGSAFPSTVLFACSWLHSQAVRGVGVGFEEPHLRLMVYFVESEFPRISHIFAYEAHQGGLVLRYGLERPLIVRIEIIWPDFV